MTFPLVRDATLNPVDPPGTWNSRGVVTAALDVVEMVTPLDGTVAEVDIRFTLQKNDPPAVETGVMRTRCTPAA